MKIRNKRDGDTLASVTKKTLSALAASFSSGEGKKEIHFNTEGVTHRHIACGQNAAERASRAEAAVIKRPH